MDNELVKKLKAGNEGAFQTCVEMYKDKVLNTCFHFLHNHLDAQDTAQEVFVEVYQSVHSFRSDAQLSTWIYRIAVNKSLDLLRKKKRKKRFGYVLSIFGEGEDSEPVYIKSESDPLQDLEVKERTDILNAAIDSLPENQKTAITLSKYDGFSNKEIAEILETSVSSVESLLHRARKNLHNKLYNYFEKNI